MIEHYHGSIYDVPHAGLLTPLMIAWVIWFLIGWRFARSVYPGAAVALALIAAGVADGIYGALIVIGWTVWLALGGVARRWYDAHLRPLVR